MRSGTTWILQAFVVLLAVAALAFLLWEPHLEGRNSQSTWTRIFFADPFLALAYLALIAFFVGLHRVFRVLGLARLSRTFSPEAAVAYRAIRNCALVVVTFVATGWILHHGFGDREDRPVSLVLGLLGALPLILVAVTAGILDQRYSERSGAALMSTPPAS